MRLDYFVELSLTSFSFIIIPFIAACFMTVSNDPPGIPGPITQPAVDCHNVRARPIVANGSRVSFSVSVGNFIEFPRESAGRLLRVATRTGGIISEHSFSYFWDLESDGENISFCILHPVTGLAHVTLMCHSKFLTDLKAPITTVDIFPVGYTRIYSGLHITGRFQEFCFSNGTLHYFAQPPTVVLPMVAAHDFALPFAVHFGPAAAFQRMQPNHTIFPLPVFFVSAAPVQVWQQVIDVLLPLWGVACQYDRRDLLRVYLTRNQVSLMRNIRRLVPAEALLNDTQGCFADGTFLRAPGAVPVDLNATAGTNISYSQAFADQFLWTVSLNRQIVEAFRGLFTNRTLKPGRVVVDRVAAALAPQIERMFPVLHVAILPDTDDIAEIADCVAQATLFISTHISTLVYSIFLSSSAALLELQPKGLECMALGHPLTKLVGAAYAPFRVASECACNYSDVECYLTTEPEYEDVTSADLRTAILKLLSS
jgi:hypothetical protein